MNQSKLSKLVSNAGFFATSLGRGLQKVAAKNVEKKLILHLHSLCPCLALKCPLMPSELLLCHDYSTSCYPKPHYPADEATLALFPAQWIISKAKDKNLSAVPCLKNLWASVSASQQESDKGGKLAQQNGGDSGSPFGFQAVYSKQPLRKMLCLKHVSHSTGLAILHLFLPKLAREGRENILVLVQVLHRQHVNI